jgi:UPF0755 protein
MKKTRRVSPEIIFLAFCFILLPCLFVYLNFFIPLSHEDSWKEIRIPEGATYTEGMNILRENNILERELPFIIMSRLTKTDRKLRAGYYNFNASMTPWEIFNRLKKGMIIQYTVTIPEGSNFDDIKAKLLSTGLVDENSWQLVKDKEFLDSLDIEAPSLEGYLYPDTYNLAKGSEPEEVFRIMVQRLRENFDDTLRERAEELGMNERQVLTLASIIEKEALYNRERPVISAVYHNRLKKNMRLQADPTVVYGIKKASDGITRTDLRRKTEYNTYVNYGLPPGPIASPGIKSIKAALYPAGVDYLYFVSKNNGTHYFSLTGEEHLKAVMLYQRKNTTPETQKETKPAVEPEGAEIHSEIETENDETENETNNGQEKTN